MIVDAIPRWMRFGAVGASAAMVHFSVVSLLVVLQGWPPLLANVLAFAVAFGVSYGGHALLTFADRQTIAARSMPRFLAVAVSGFVCNEFLYWIALRLLQLPYQLALALVLVIVAGMTWILSNTWAFSEQR